MEVKEENVRSLRLGRLIEIHWKIVFLLDKNACCRVITSLLQLTDRRDHRTTRTDQHTTGDRGSVLQIY